MKRESNSEAGLIKMVILIIIALLVLSYFGISLRSVAESDKAKDNFGYVWGKVEYVWDNYLERPAKYIWNEIFLRLVWHPSVRNLEQINNGEPMDMENQAPGTPKAPAY